MHIHILLIPQILEVSGRSNIHHFPHIQLIHHHLLQHNRHIVLKLIAQANVSNANQHITWMKQIIAYRGINFDYIYCKNIPIIIGVEGDNSCLFYYCFYFIMHVYMDKG